MTTTLGDRAEKAGASPNKRAYLAGKISKHCWRHQYVRGLRDAVHHDPEHCVKQFRKWLEATAT